MDIKGEAKKNIDYFPFKLAPLRVIDREGEAEKVIIKVIMLLSELGWGKARRERLWSSSRGVGAPEGK